VPATGLWRILTIVDTASGFVTISMVITYFLSVYGNLGSRNAFALGLHHRTGASDDSPPTRCSPNWSRSGRRSRSTSTTGAGGPSASAMGCASCAAAASRSTTPRWHSNATSRTVRPGSRGCGTWRT